MVGDYSIKSTIHKCDVKYTMIMLAMGVKWSIHSRVSRYLSNAMKLRNTILRRWWRWMMVLCTMAKPTKSMWRLTVEWRAKNMIKRLKNSNTLTTRHFFSWFCDSQPSSHITCYISMNPLHNHNYSRVFFVCLFFFTQGGRIS